MYEDEPFGTALKDALRAELESLACVLYYA